MPHISRWNLLEIFVSMVRRNVWMASVDLKYAFFTIPICEDDIKYLKFLWDGQVLAFLAMPNGYSDAMRIFTKILYICKVTLVRNVAKTFWTH